MRRIIGFLFVCAIIAGLGLVVYSYVVDLPSPAEVVETPAVGVGFSE